MKDDRSDVLSPLRLRLLALAGISALAVTVLSGTIDALTGSRLAFALMSSLVISSLLGFTWTKLRTNRLSGLNDSKDVLPRFGWGTTITLGRAVLLGLLAGFLLVPRPLEVAGWWPAVLYTLFVIADFLDGFVARRTNMATELGATLDMELDALGTLIAVVLAIVYGNLPIWYLSIGLARYAFVLALSWRQFLEFKVQPLPPNRNRRLTAGFQMGFLSAALWPILPASGLRTAALVFGGLSLFGFARDWLVQSDKLDPNSTSYVGIRTSINKMLEGFLPLVRALVAGFVLARALAYFGFSSLGADLVSSEALSQLAATKLGAFAPWAFALFLLAATGLLVGFLSRIAALVITLFFALEFTCCSGTLVHQVPLLMNLCVLVLGPGAFALFAPEGELLKTQHGKPRA